MALAESPPVISALVQLLAPSSLGPALQGKAARAADRLADSWAGAAALTQFGAVAALLEALTHTHAHGSDSESESGSDGDSDSGGGGGSESDTGGDASPGCSTGGGSSDSKGGGSSDSKGGGPASPSRSAAAHSSVHPSLWFRALRLLVRLLRRDASSTPPPSPPPPTPLLDAAIAAIAARRHLLGRDGRRRSDAAFAVVYLAAAAAAAAADPRPQLATSADLAISADLALPAISPQLAISPRVPLPAILRTALGRAEVCADAEVLRGAARPLLPGLARLSPGASRTFSEPSRNPLGTFCRLSPGASLHAWLQRCQPLPPAEWDETHPRLRGTFAEPSRNLLGGMGRDAPVPRARRLCGGGAARPASARAGREARTLFPDPSRTLSGTF